MPRQHDETARDFRTTTLRVRSASLKVVEGADMGVTSRVLPTITVVGSGDTADMCLSDTTVSREHLRVSLTPAGVRLRDESSKNGTWIGPVRITDALITGDVLVRLGSTMLGLVLDAAPTEFQVSSNTTFGPALGISAAMRYVFATLEQSARSEVTVLLEGESGVGKEVLARATHERSDRPGPYVAVDCGAIPENLIESDLFGHVRGAFTGALDHRVGVFEEADGGTIFLDEIGELSLEHQTRLLRVLETREVRPVGGTRGRHVDVRVIAATNRNLEELVRTGAFRSDLYYRLAVVRVRVPPLRDRPEDVLLLASRFFCEATGDDTAELPKDIAGMLALYPWPGNVRELRNVVQRFTVLGRADALFDDKLRAEQATSSLAEGLEELSFHDARRVVLERFERSYLSRVLERSSGVVSHAASHAKLARPSFHRMMKRLDLRAATDESE